MTYENILERMLTQVTTLYPDLDTRESSIIYNALAPAAIELAIAYVELYNILSESFVATATREYLILACLQSGIDVSSFDASNGQHKALFDVPVSLNSRWNCDLYNYIVIEDKGQDENGYYEYVVECETAGTAPNNIKGALTAISESPNELSYAELIECVIEGEDESTEDEIRDTYFNFINSTTADGNVGQYELWCSEYDGIGNYKILPQWNGANTVKVSILSSSNRKASDTLINEFQEYLDPNAEGMGNGVAPIGAFVTVSTATEIPIEVSANVVLKDGYTDTTLIDNAIENYFSEIAYEKSVLSYMKLGAIIQDAECVDFISNLLVNGGTADITLGDEEIPVKGTTSWTVVT